MDGMAVGADYLVLRMGGPADIGSAKRLIVASQAVIHDLPGFELRESDDGCFPAARLDVSLAGTVATLAARPFGRLVARGDALIVRILVEIQPYIGVAGSTDVTSDEVAG